MSRKLPRLAILCFLLACLSPLFSSEEFFATFRNDSRSLLFFHAQFFFLGGVSYAIWKLLREYTAISSSMKPPPQGIAICGLAAAFFIPDLVIAAWTFLFACLCQIASAPYGIEARIIEAIGCNRVVLFIGRISYSIYLVHWPLGIVILRFWKSFVWMDWATFVICYLIVAPLATIGVATLLYYLVEAPAIRWGKKMFREPLKLA
jgi:peptidoglycan/LPS O-acetylase OafA/YrhL